MKKLNLLMLLALSMALLVTNVSSQISNFKGGVRIPAASCPTYPSNKTTEIIGSGGGGLSVFNMSGRIQVIAVCQLPVPEKALVRQFVIVGNVSKGTISAWLGGIMWNAPRQASQYASVSMNSNTPFEIPQMKQKKVVQNLPVSGLKSLRTDRSQTYFIEATFSSASALNIEEALELFYFEVYWD
jgi:hypothetical protein